MPGRRKRRPAISREERLRWLQELEHGKGITAIAREAGRDIRVVKRHIEIAQQESELAWARRDFIKGRLEQHQQDLLAEAERLRSVLGTQVTVPLEPRDPLKKKVHQALREHVQRLLLSRLLTEYDHKLEELSELRSGLRYTLQKKEAELLAALPTRLPTNPWANNLVDALERHAWTGVVWRGQHEATEAAGYEGYHLHWGELALTRLPVAQGDVANLGQAHRELCAVAETLLPSLLERVHHLKGLGAQIREELDVFVLKRMVPGRCRYCPA